MRFPGIMEWRKITGYENYEISSSGEVRGKVGIMAQRDCRGYRRIDLTDGTKQRVFRIHRLVALAFIPQIPGKTYVDHINGNKSDNTVENLRWVTASENMLNPNTPRPPGKFPHRHIYMIDRPRPFMVQIRRNNVRVFYKLCRTLPEAIEARDTYLNSL